MSLKQRFSAWSGRAAVPDTTEPDPRREMIFEQLRRMPAPDRLASSPVSQLLLDRLDADDVAEIERLATEEEMQVLRDAAPKDQVWVKLAAGVTHAIPSVLSKTGLSPEMPPEDVHAMSRSWLGCGGSYGHADLVADSLATAGAPLKPGMAGLDFGCSSARVVRVLAAAYPEVDWHGCDPNEGAIEWSAATLKDIGFQVNPTRPPLPFAGASLDFAFAISIWSHFAEAPALLWFEEMRRIIKPGGHLIFTTHGWTSIAYYLETGERSEEQLLEIALALLASGYYYHAEFGKQGDHGVVDDDWGTAFFTPGWVATNLCPDWHLVRFSSGRECGNQDLYVLRRS